MKSDDNFKENSAPKSTKDVFYEDQKSYATSFVLKPPHCGLALESSAIIR